MQIEQEIIFIQPMKRKKQNRLSSLSQNKTFFFNNEKLTIVTFDKTENKLIERVLISVNLQMTGIKSWVIKYYTIQFSIKSRKGQVINDKSNIGKMSSPNKVWGFL